MVLPFLRIWRKTKQNCSSPSCSAVPELGWCNRTGPPPTAAWPRSPCLWRTSAAPPWSASTVHTFPIKDKTTVTTVTTVCSTPLLQQQHFQVYSLIPFQWLCLAWWQLWNTVPKSSTRNGRRYSSKGPEERLKTFTSTFSCTPRLLQSCTHLRKNVSSLGFFHRH